LRFSLPQSLNAQALPQPADSKAQQFADLTWGKLAPLDPDPIASRADHECCDPGAVKLEFDICPCRDLQARIHERAAETRISHQPAGIPLRAMHAHARSNVRTLTPSMLHPAARGGSKAIIGRVCGAREFRRG